VDLAEDEADVEGLGVESLEAGGRARFMNLSPRVPFERDCFGGIL